MQPDGETIRRQRVLRGYGLRRFAKAAGITPGYLSRIEHGQRHPQPEVMARIAETLGVPMTSLMQRDAAEGSDEDHGLAVPDDEGTRGPHP